MPREQNDRHWQAPPRDAAPSTKMGYINDIVQYGEQWNQSQFSSRDLVAAIDLISGRQKNQPNQSRSALTINREKRSIRELNANIADIRAVDAYTSDNPAYQNFLSMLNKVWKSVFFESKFPRAMKKNVQWMTAGGYAYISPVYRNVRLAQRSAKRIDFDVFSCNDVLGFQVPDDFNVQGAYAWTLMRFMPEFEAASKFPKFADQLRPVARRRYSGNSSKDRIALAQRFREAAQGDHSTTVSNWAMQMDEIRYTYINDMAINETKKPIAMGVPGALESYIVPYVGMEIPTEEFNQGVRIMRKAQEEDCYLYPNKRLIISQKGMAMPMYDGPAFDWHGWFPLARFSADAWPWDPGYSTVKEVQSVSAARQSFFRGMDQTAKQRFDPAMLYDKNAGLNRKTMEQFDPYEERGRLGVDGEISENMLRTALPENLLNLPEWAFAYLKTLDDNSDYLLGNDAMNNLAKARIAAADDALQKAMEEAGPIVKDISHGMEDPMADIMFMVMNMVLQYYPPGRIMQYVGPNGVAREVFDFEPDSLVPSHAPTENKAFPSAYTRMQRVQQFCQNIHANITPGSLHGVVQTQTKLIMMQMQRAGFKISSETVAKSADIPNWGTLEGNTELEKWQTEKEMDLEFAAKMQALGASLQGAPGAPPQSPMMAQAASGGKPRPGRPPSGNKPPHMVTKGSAEGPRTTITES